MSVAQWSEDPDVRARGLDATAIENRKREDWTDHDALTIAKNRRRSARARMQSIDDGVAFADDEVAVAFVNQHPDGATLEEVGNAFGLTRERVRQIEAVALRKLLEALGPEGVREFVVRRRRHQEREASKSDGETTGGGE